jgi:PIN domain nuclease of toxin-antitoxin system
MILLDTHVLVWFAIADKRLGRRSQQRIQKGLREGMVSVSALSYWEISLLASAGRLRLDDTPDGFRRAAQAAGIEEVPVDGAIAILAARLGGLHPDPADRMIVATALERRATLLTADAKILAATSGLTRLDAQS